MQEESGAVYEGDGPRSIAMNQRNYDWEAAIGKLEDAKLFLETLLFRLKYKITKDEGRIPWAFNSVVKDEKDKPMTVHDLEISLLTLFTIAGGQLEEDLEPKLPKKDVKLASRIIRIVGAFIIALTIFAIMKIATNENRLRKAGEAMGRQQGRLQQSCGNLPLRSFGLPRSSEIDHLGRI